MHSSHSGSYMKLEADDFLFRVRVKRLSGASMRLNDHFTPHGSAYEIANRDPDSDVACR